ncbi:antirestriction protein [Chromobacterium amazonense]|uniref:antirestriction protein n=1 Tax=Chromobacterium amazonense TaxID=1382803 RepID=UPI003F7A4797
MDLQQQQVTGQDRHDTRIQARVVDDNHRGTFLPDMFGTPLFMRGEGLVFAWMRRLVRDYHGGVWVFYTLDNGGFYLAPKTKEPFALSVAGNGYAGEMSADAAGIVATLFALCQLSHEFAETDQGDRLADRYHALLAFAAEHAEAGAIRRAID